MFALILGFLFFCCFSVSANGIDELERLWNSGFPAAHLDSNGTVERGSAWVWAQAASATAGKTRPDVFARLSGLVVGAPVEMDALPKAQKKLLRSGYFEETGGTFQLFRVKNRNSLVGVFPVRDAAASSLEFWASYAQEGGWNGNLQASLLNIAGTARDFSMRAETGEERKSVKLFYKEPFLFGSGWDLRLEGLLSEDDSVRSEKLLLSGAWALGFEWELSVGGGRKNGRWISSVGAVFDDRDRLPLARQGLFVQGNAELSGFAAGTLEGLYLLPLWGNWGLGLGAQGGGMWPARGYERQELFALGGQADFRALAPASVYSRSYGTALLDAWWQGFSKTALHLFVQPGLYRERPPFRGWNKVWGYGAGFEQGGRSFSAALYYTLMQGLGWEEGLLNFSVKTVF